MIVLKFKTEIKGDCTAEDHKDWITCDSFQLGVGRSISSSGGGKERNPSAPSFSEVTLTKASDMASADLYMQAVCGKSLGKAEIHFLQTDGENTQVYMKYELEEAIISSYSISSGGDKPSESFSINFSKISKQYDSFDGKTIKTGTAKKWDLMANKTY